MQIAQILSGYSLGEADLLRRAMGKKKKEEMDKQRARFLDGAAKKDVTAKRASFIFDLVAEFAGYGFNKSHAAAYALIAYRTAFLKANYPVAFMAGLMSLDMANTDKLAVFFQECKAMGLVVRPPDVNKSEADFAVEDGTIRYALGAIRNVGYSAMEHVAAVRRSGGPFKDIFDFAERVDPRQVNKRAFENLARAGAFDSLDPDRGRLFASAEMLLSLAQQAQAERDSAQSSLFGGGDEAPNLAHPNLPDIDPWDPIQRLDEELSAIGFYLSGHPLDDMREALARRSVILCTDAPIYAAEGRRAARMAGVVRRKQEKVSRKSNEKFAFLTLSDPSGEFEPLVPPEVLRTYRDQLEPGEAVIVSCRLDMRDEQLRLIVDSVEPLSNLAAEAAGEGIRIHIREGEALDLLKTRLERANLREDALRGRVHLALRLSDGRHGEVRLPGKHAIDSAAKAAIKAIKGVSEIETL